MNIEIPNNISESAAAEIQAIIDREKAKVGAFVPKDGEKYWAFCGDDADETTWVMWWGDPTDKERLRLGNCFPTEEAARAAAPAYLAKSDAQYAIALWLAEHQNWLATDKERADDCLIKYYVHYDVSLNILLSHWCQGIEPIGPIIFRKREYAEQFIADCGEYLRVVHGLPEGK